ncbi:type II toxin-antitoxin system HicB family antitoxin [Dehalobacter sp. DCM]|uniref:type II toxin-antitoxin system HicB family antitoxin n=1 Tax=Dehalobacter sp. DCM TaxID=2907827 RepID=UPI003081D5F1
MINLVHKVTAIVQQDDNWYVAKCLENNVASQGKTVEEAIANLKEALELYYEDVPSDIVEPRQTFVTTLEVTV